MRQLVRSRLWLIVAAPTMTIAACGGDNDEGVANGNDGRSGSDGVSHQDASPEDLEIWQTDLNAVGCYAGDVDGSLGPQTESAIKAFQAAKDLRVGIAQLRHRLQLNLTGTFDRGAQWSPGATAPRSHVRPPRVKAASAETAKVPTAGPIRVDAGTKKLNQCDV